jgi:hypothetical protein
MRNAARWPTFLPRRFDPAEGSVAVGVSGRPRLPTIGDGFPHRSEGLQGARGDSPAGLPRLFPDVRSVAVRPCQNLAGHVAVHLRALGLHSDRRDRSLDLVLAAGHDIAFAFALHRDVEANLATLAGSAFFSLTSFVSTVRARSKTSLSAGRR